MKLENANIESFAEAERRLRNGEVFYSKGQESKIYYSESFLPDESPYRLDNEPLGPYWDDFRKWQKEIKWKPCLCWVSDSSKNKKNNATVIVTENPYIDNEGIDWLYATPVTKEDLDNVLP